MSEQIAATILAAGKMPADLESATGAGAKGLVEVGGRPTIDRILDAVQAAQHVGEVRVVCAEGSPLLAHVGDLGVAASGPTYLDSIRTGYEALGGPERMLVITGDLPLLTPASLDHFSLEALQSGASLVYSIIRKDDCERVFPGGQRTFVRLADGKFTGGNVAMLARDFIETHGERLSQVFASRKNPLRLCTMLGWGFVFRLLFGRLGVADAVRRAGQLLGTTAHAVTSPYPELGFDVDKVSNLETVEAWLADRPD